ncbi:MAG: TldD/PmbA family protein [Ignavibacteria bacterium]|nr:TldD/PmbA family protein [Ignavibacteria bacterium]
MRRRDFIKSTVAGCCGAIAGGIALEKALGNIAFDNNACEEALRSFGYLSEDDFNKLADTSIFIAGNNGASYCDLRICKNRNQYISTKEEMIQSISDGENLGFGVRVLINGTWGFASSSLISETEVAKVTELACEISKANSILQKVPVELVMAKSYEDKYNTPLQINPFEISITDKINLQLKFNNLAKSQGADYVDSFMWFINEWKYFASSEGSRIIQDLYRTWAETDVTLVDKKEGKFESRSTDIAPLSIGYEYFTEFPFEKEIEKSVETAGMKLKAPAVEPGKKDIIIHGNNLFLTIHESCGHPTELDRALGYEANYAGTSFMTTDKLGKLKYGSDLINLIADRTQEYGLATRGYDDDGVKTVEWPIIENGMFVNYQTTREQGKYIDREDSFACSYADSWSHFPIQRMPNISLRPSAEKRSLDDLIADTEDAILVIGRGSWSIDMQRYNFQFTGQEFWEIKNGKKTGMVNDVAYQGNTIDFWNSCDAICDESEYYLGGSLFCGKGEPSQLSPVSHGAVPARFRQVNILNTKSQI